MRKPLIIANLFLMLILIFTLQAQNHNNYGGNNHYQGNNSNHHQQNYCNPIQFREFSGVLVRNNDNNHSNNENWNHIYNRPHHHSNHNNSSHNRRADFGILTKAGKHDTRYLRFDEKGNRLVRDLLRSQRKPNNKVYVRVKGYVDRSGTLNVVSLSRLHKPDRFFASFGNPNHGGWNNNGWSFQLFVGLN